MADCFFHTGRPSVIRCKQCGRPLCTECRKVNEGGVFCSDKCANSFQVFADRAEKLEEKRSRSGGVNTAVKLIIFLLLILLLYAAAKRFL